MEEKYLSQLYYNPESPVSFGGVDSIYHAVKNDAKYDTQGKNGCKIGQVCETCEQRFDAQNIQNDGEVNERGS